MRYPNQPTRPLKTKVTLQGLAPGRAGIRQTLRLMSRQISLDKKDLRVRQLAASLVEHLPAKNWLGEIKALHGFVQNSIRYLRDIDGVETVSDSLHTLEMGQGDCDDSAVLLGSLLKSIGHPVRLIAAGFNGGPLSHVYVETLVANKWTPLECTEPLQAGEPLRGITTTMIQNVDN